MGKLLRFPKPKKRAKRRPSGLPVITTKRWKQELAAVVSIQSKFAVDEAYDLYLKANELDTDPLTFSKAESLYFRALHLDPRLSQAWTNLGNIYYKTHREFQAVVFWQRALSITPKQPQAHYNLGYYFLEKFNFEDARKSFIAAIECDPLFEDAWFNLAESLAALGRIEEAKKAYARFVLLDPDSKFASRARRMLT